MKVFSSRELNQDIGRAKKAAANGPVIITDRGAPSHVLLNIDDYRRLSEGVDSVVDGLSSEDTVHIESYMNNRSFGARKVALD